MTIEMQVLDSEMRDKITPILSKKFATEVTIV
jgi:hypothetical protein